MKKYFYLFFVTLFVTMSFALASCSDDDEPNDPTEQPEVGNDSEMKVFTANDVQYYYSRYSNGAPCIGFWDDSTAGIGAEFSIRAYSVIRGITVPQNEKVTQVELQIDVLESIDKMTHGKKLTLVTYDGLLYSFGWLHNWDEDNKAHCRYIVKSGDVYCDSKKGDVITLKLNDLLLTKDTSDGGINAKTLPASLKISGIVKYKK